MASNLPPGVTESMIPGNRPEDQEVEVLMVFSCGEIEELREFDDYQQTLPVSHRHKLWSTVSNIVEQFETEDSNANKEGKER